MIELDYDTSMEIWCDAYMKCYPDNIPLGGLPVVDFDVGESIE